MAMTKQDGEAPHSVMLAKKQSTSSFLMSQVTVVWLRPQQVVRELLMFCLKFVKNLEKKSSLSLLNEKCSVCIFSWVVDFTSPHCYAKWELSKTFWICSRKKLIVIFFPVLSSCFDVASLPTSHVMGKSRSFSILIKSLCKNAFFLTVQVNSPETVWAWRFFISRLFLNELVVNLFNRFVV